ncbi:MAG: hypothetical protein RI897_3505 [Verrucomicrobiota bacterium]
MGEVSGELLEPVEDECLGVLEVGFGLGGGGGGEVEGSGGDGAGEGMGGVVVEEFG